MVVLEKKSKFKELSPFLVVQTLIQRKPHQETTFWPEVKERLILILIKDSTERSQMIPDSNLQDIFTHQKESSKIKLALKTQSYFKQKAIPLFTGKKLLTKPYQPYLFMVTTTFNLLIL